MKISREKAGKVDDVLIEAYRGTAVATIQKKLYDILDIEEEILPEVSCVMPEKDGDCWVLRSPEKAVVAHVYREADMKLYVGAKALRDWTYLFFNSGDHDDLRAALKAVDVEVE